MKKRLSVVGTEVAFLFAFALSFNTLISNAKGLGEFSKTCRNASIRGSSLSASCEKAKGGYQNTRLDLNPYIGNKNGELSWNDRNFIATCNDTKLSGEATLEAKCLTIRQKRVATSINLDNHIANINGTLRYE